MAEEYISQSEFARRIGTTQASVSRGRNKGKVATTRSGKVKYNESLDLWFNNEGVAQPEGSGVEQPETESNPPEPESKPSGADSNIPESAIAAIEDTFFETNRL